MRTLRTATFYLSFTSTCHTDISGPVHTGHALRGAPAGQAASSPSSRTSLNTMDRLVAPRSRCSPAWALSRATWKRKGTESGICTPGKAAPSQLNDPRQQLTRHDPRQQLTREVSFAFIGLNCKWASGNCRLPPLTDKTRDLEMTLQGPEGERTCTQRWGAQCFVLELWCPWASCCSPPGLPACPVKRSQRYPDVFFSAEAQRLSSDSKEGL